MTESHHTSNLNEGRKIFMKGKKILAGILSAAAVFSAMAMSVFAENKNNSTVYEVTTQEELTNAVNALNEGDTIKLHTGSYEGFDVLKDNVTIEGADKDTTVTVTKTLFSFIGVNADNLTVKNINFVIPEDVSLNPKHFGYKGYCAVIGFHNMNFDSGTQKDTRIIENCTFTNKSDTLSNAIFGGEGFTISDCKFENFDKAIVVMNDNMSLKETKIERNTFTKVDEPLNAYWGGADGKTISFTENEIVSAKHSYELPFVSIQDCNSEGGFEGLTVTGNTYKTSKIVEVINVQYSIINSDGSVIVNYTDEDTASKKTEPGDTFYINFSSPYFDVLKQVWYNVQGENILQTKNEKGEIIYTKTARIYRNGFTDPSEPVYMIENYATLADAVKAANSGDIIRLLCDDSSSVKIGDAFSYLSEDITIDLNGYTYEGNIENYGYNITLKNGEIFSDIINNGSLELSKITSHYTSLISNYGLLSISYCDIVGGVSTYTGSDTTIYKTSICGNYGVGVWGGDISEDPERRYVYLTDCHVYEAYHSEDHPFIAIHDNRSAEAKAALPIAVEIEGGLYGSDVSKYCAPGYGCEYNGKEYAVKLLETIWTTKTDSGYYYDDNDAKFGMMRFMFWNRSKKDVIKSGIKYISSADMNDGKTFDTSTGAKIFQGDIIEIPEPLDEDADSAEKKYYAAAYITTSDGTTYWSNPISCKVNWNRELTDYNPDNNGGDK